MKRRAGLWLLTGAGLLWIGFIWGHSLVPAVNSSQESGAVLAVLEGVFRRLGLPGVLNDHLVRKAAHFTEYLILGVLGTSALWGWAGRRGLILLPTVSLLVPLMDETIQLFVPGRSGEIADVWLDILGFGVGVCLAGLWRAFFRLVRKSGNGNDFIKNG